MEKELKKLLDQIDTFLAKSPNAQELWDILTALRGPDSGYPDLKDATTAVIRKHALPKTYQQKYAGAYHPGEIPAILREDCGEAVSFRKDWSPPNRGSHFWVHTMRAFRTLDLNWDSNNDPKPKKKKSKSKYRRTAK